MKEIKNETLQFFYFSPLLSMYLFNYLNIFCETLMYSLYLQLQIYYNWTYFLPSLVPSLFINAFNINLLLMSLINYIVYLFQREYVNVEEIQLMVWLIVSIVLYIRFERRHNNILLLSLLLINIIMLISRKNRYSYMKYWILSNTALHFVLSYYVSVFLSFCVSVFPCFYHSKLKDMINFHNKRYNNKIILSLPYVISPSNALLRHVRVSIIWENTQREECFSLYQKRSCYFW